MARVEEYRTTLRGLDPRQVPAYLTASSGLPGPRANLALLDAFGDVAPAGLVRDMATDADEYRRSCGTAALGRLVVEATDAGARSALDLLHDRAADSSWRVREAVAMALQRVGDARPALLRDLVASGVSDPHPLVRRAAVAGVCEPRLLTEPRTAVAARAACRAATDSIEALPHDARRDPDVRTLRQALGYCWSVAVAADPAAGLAAFADLAASHDPDTAWIVRSNRGKKRLARLLDADAPSPGDEDLAPGAHRSPT